jgi:transposase-like protein
MKENPLRYLDQSPEVIQLAVTMYFHFPLKMHDVEDLLD